MALVLLCLLSASGFALASLVAFPCLAQLGCAGAWSDPAIPDSGDREVPAVTSARHSSIGWRHHRDALSFPDCTLKSGGILLSFGPARTDFIYLFLR